MSSITEDVTEQYFESKAEEEMDTNSVIFEHMTVMSYQEVLRDKRFMGYTDSQIVKYTIPSSSIKHDQCYIHVEEVVRDIIDTGITVNPTFYKNIQDKVLPIKESNIGTHSGYIRLENYPTVRIETDNWRVDGKAHKNNKYYTEPSVEDKIKIANELSRNDIPMIKGNFEYPEEWNNGSDIAYPLYLNCIDSQIYFKFSNYNIANNSTFGEIVKHVGGSPEFIPNAELYIVPSWLSIDTIKDDTTGMWSLTTKQNVEDKYTPSYTKIINKFKFW